MAYPAEPGLAVEVLVAPGASPDAVRAPSSGHVDVLALASFQFKTSVPGDGLGAENAGPDGLLAVVHELELHR